MIKNFDDAFAALMGNEKGYTADPRDPGNWSSGVVNVGTLDGSMWGVSAPVARRHGYTGLMQDLPQALAKQFAKSEYWDPYLLDQIDPRIAFQVMDAAYNGGHPAVWLQQAAIVTADGRVGAATVAAVRSLDPRTVILRFDAYRLQYLASLSTWPTFGKGWVNRIVNNMLLTAE